MAESKQPGIDIIELKENVEEKFEQERGNGESDNSNTKTDIYNNATDSSSSTRMDRIIILGNLDSKTKSKDVKEHFQSYGDIERVNVKRDIYSGASMRFAFVIFKDAESVGKALADDHIINDRKIHTKKGMPDPGIIFVSNIGRNLSDIFIKHYFSQYGKIVDIDSVNVLTVKKTRYLCFVVFESGDAVQEILKFKKHIVKNKTVRVSAFEEICPAPPWMARFKGNIDKLNSGLPTWEIYKQRFYCDEKNKNKEGMEQKIIMPGTISGGGFMPDTSNQDIMKSCDIYGNIVEGAACSIATIEDSQKRMEQEIPMPGTISSGGFIPGISYEDMMRSCDKYGNIVEDGACIMATRDDNQLEIPGQRFDNNGMEVYFNPESENAELKKNMKQRSEKQVEQLGLDNNSGDLFDVRKYERGCYPCTCGCGKLAANCNMVCNNSNGNSNGEQCKPKIERKVTFNTKMDRTLLVGNLSRYTEISDLREHFEPYGIIEIIHVKRDFYTHFSMKFAYITFSNTESVDKVLTDYHVINNSKVQVMKVRQSCGIIYISNLGRNLSENDIRGFFSQYGTVVDVVIVHAMKGSRVRYFSFVSFESGHIAQKVLTSRKTVINKKCVTVSAFEEVTGTPEWMSQMDGDIEKLDAIFQDWALYKQYVSTQIEKENSTVEETNFNQRTMCASGLLPEFSDQDNKKLFAESGNIVEISNKPENADIKPELEEDTGRATKKPSQFTNGKDIKIMRPRHSPFSESTSDYPVETRADEYSYSVYDYKFYICEFDYTGGYYLCFCGCGNSAADCHKIH